MANVRDLWSVQLHVHHIPNCSVLTESREIGDSGRGQLVTKYGRTNVTGTVTLSTNDNTLTGQFHQRERRGSVARAYVMVKTDTGMAEKVQDEFRRVPGVQAVDIVTGEYDLVIVVEGPSNEDIGRLVMRDIHGTSGVDLTTTFVVIG